MEQRDTSNRCTYWGLNQALYHLLEGLKLSSHGVLLTLQPLALVLQGLVLVLQVLVLVLQVLVLVLQVLVLVLQVLDCVVEPFLQVLVFVACLWIAKEISIMTPADRVRERQRRQGGVGGKPSKEIRTLLTKDFKSPR